MILRKGINFQIALQNAGVGVDHRLTSGLASAINVEFVGNLLMLQTWHCQKRFMKSRRMRDRSKKKKEPTFEKVMERQKPVRRVLSVMEILKHEPEHVMTLKSMAKYKRQLNMDSDVMIPHFLRKHYKLFELYTDRRGATWCGLTAEAESLLEEEMRLKEEYQSTTVNYVRRLLMMSVDNRLEVDKIAHLKRDMGLPDDFRNDWIYNFPEYFTVVTDDDDVLYLKLTSWDTTLAVTELERKSKEATEQNFVCSEGNSTPGLLTVPFPLRWPSHYPKLKRPDIAMRKFQKMPYLSPYADASELAPGSKEFEKRSVAVLHEMLSFTLEKKLIADHLTHFRWEFRLPQKLMRLLLRYFGIFYVSEKGNRFHVFLTSAYEGSELIEKSPFVLWKEKVEKLMGETRNRRRWKTTYVDYDDEISDQYSSGHDSVKVEDEEVANDVEKES